MAGIIHAAKIYFSYANVLALIFFGGLFYVFCAIWKERKSPLKTIAGPWYAPYTSLHLRWFFARGTIPDYVWKQHDKYGPVMRLGPRQIWISDKDALKQILSTIDLPKVAMYAEISRDKTSPGLFGEVWVKQWTEENLAVVRTHWLISRRPDPHKKLRRFLSPAFTVKYVDDLDFLFQQCIELLLRKYYALSCSETQSFQTDLNEDLHSLALDM